jgi:hypothetical protein
LALITRIKSALANRSFSNHDLLAARYFDVAVNSDVIELPVAIVPIRYSHAEPHSFEEHGRFFIGAAYTENRPEVVSAWRRSFGANGSWLWCGGHVSEV